MADFVAIGLRGLAFAAALLAAGMPVFIWVFGRDLDRSAQRIRALALPIAASGLALTIAHAIVEPVRLAGAMSGIFDGSLQSMLLASDFGTTTAIRTLGLVMIVGGWLKPGRSGEGIALTGASLVIASFAFMGHTAAHPQRWLLAPLLITHLFAAAFWFGSLWPLAAVTRYEDFAVAGAIIERFSSVAVWSVPVIFIAGIVLASLLLPDLSSLRTPYGLSLISKVFGFAILMGLAAMNRWRFGPAIFKGEQSALKGFRRSVLAEWLLILVVVLVTAVMTASFSPEP